MDPQSIAAEERKPWGISWFSPGVGLFHLEEENMKSKYTFISLRDRPELMDRAAAWFHEKWRVPKEAYLECMTAYLNRETEYGWYLCLSGERIVGGLGVIENDFHNRKEPIMRPLSSRTFSTLMPS